MGEVQRRRVTDNHAYVDIADDHSFRSFMVGTLQDVSVNVARLDERTKGLDLIKVEFPVLQEQVKGILADKKDEKFWHNLKSTAGPVLVILHIIATKLGLPFVAPPIK